MAKNKIVIANWKMNPVGEKEAEKIFSNIIKNIKKIKKTEVVICPPFVYLGNLRKFGKKIMLGAQNTFYEESGAHTGEISADMLDNLGTKYVILGHSERRAKGENNEEVNKKIKCVLDSGLIPIVCIGEKERDEKHEYLNFVKKQTEECLNGVSKNSISKVIIVYEPVWAISANKIREAIPEEFREMAIFIRKILNDKFGAKMIKKIKIVYGGSVNPKNALGFLSEGKADGLLVGRDSLDPKKFVEIINITENYEKR